MALLKRSHAPGSHRRPPKLPIRNPPPSAAPSNRAVRRACRSRRIPTGRESGDAAIPAGPRRSGIVRCQMSQLRQRGLGESPLPCLPGNQTRQQGAASPPSESIDAKEPPRSSASHPNPPGRLHRIPRHRGLPTRRAPGQSPDAGHRRLGIWKLFGTAAPSPSPRAGPPPPPRSVTPAPTSPQERLLIQVELQVMNGFNKSPAQARRAGRRRIPPGAMALRIARNRPPQILRKHRHLRRIAPDCVPARRRPLQQRVSRAAGTVGFTRLGSFSPRQSRQRTPQSVHPVQRRSGFSQSPRVRNAITRAQSEHPPGRQIPPASAHCCWVPSR